jgi:hypothetical protein
MVDRLVGERLQQRLDPAEALVDHLLELAARLLPVGRRQALPEETVVPQLGAIVEQLGITALLGRPDDLD